MLHGVLVSVARLPLLFRGDVLRDSSLAVLIFASPVLLLFLAWKVRSGMRLSVASQWAILGVYSFWAAGLLFEPRTFDDGLGNWVNLVPFKTIAGQVQTLSGSAIVQLVGNVGLLLPLGLIGPLVMPSLRRAPRLALVALGVSAVIELVQLLGTGMRVMERSVDIDDVILNVAGALLGWLLWRAVASLRVREPRSTAPSESLS